GSGEAADVHAGVGNGAGNAGTEAGLVGAFDSQCVHADGAAEADVGGGADGLGIGERRDEDARGVFADLTGDGQREIGAGGGEGFEDAGEHAGAIHDVAGVDFNLADLVGHGQSPLGGRIVTPYQRRASAAVSSRRASRRCRLRRRSSFSMTTRRFASMAYATTSGESTA